MIVKNYIKNHLKAALNRLNIHTKKTDQRMISKIDVQLIHFNHQEFLRVELIIKTNEINEIYLLFKDKSIKASSI